MERRQRIYGEYETPHPMGIVDQEISRVRWEWLEELAVWVYRHNPYDIDAEEIALAGSSTKTVPLNVIEEFLGRRSIEMRAAYHFPSPSTDAWYGTLEMAAYIRGLGGRTESLYYQNLAPFNLITLPQDKTIVWS